MLFEVNFPEVTHSTTVPEISCESFTSASKGAALFVVLGLIAKKGESNFFGRINIRRAVIQMSPV